VEFQRDKRGQLFLRGGRENSRTTPSSRTQELLDRESQAGLDGPERTVHSPPAPRPAGRIAYFLFPGERRPAGALPVWGLRPRANVLLQYCGLSGRELYAIGEVNEDKFGAFTAGSLIPIRPEQELFRRRAGFFLVLPWHFREFFIRKYKPKKAACIPLPKLDVVRRPD